VFLVSIKTNQSQDEAQQILEALRKVQDSPELQADAKQNPESVLDRLGLSGAARHAVALGIAGLLVGEFFISPDGFWVN
jgi:hypothetical protein